MPTTKSRRNVARKMIHKPVTPRRSLRHRRPSMDTAVLLREAPVPSPPVVAPTAPAPVPPPPVVPPTATVPSPAGESLRESVIVLNEDTVQVTTTRTFNTTLVCPCPDKYCTTKMAVGTYGCKGGGQVECPHCGAKPKHACWSSGADFSKHVRTRKCEETQTVRVLRDPTPKLSLGRPLAHHIDDEEYILEQAGIVTRFKCPVPACGRLVRYGYRYGHCVVCFHKHGIKTVADLRAIL